jgi:hypothetical protein
MSKKQLDVVSSLLGHSEANSQYFDAKTIFGIFDLKINS